MKKYVKSFFALCLTGVLTIGALSGCTKPIADNSSEENNTNQNATTSSGETINVDFWTAPQSVQFNFWSNKADDFNNANVTVNGKTVKVLVQQMPESPSSEAGIQNALATKTAPALSENINRGFAKILSSSEVIYDLSKEDWFNEVINSRSFEEGIKAWEIDGSQYVLPLYVNPMVYQWNMKALKAMGINEPPITVEDLKYMVAKFRENKDTSLKELGVTNTFYRPSLTRQDQWWDRWFDFQMQYVAFTQGKSWVENDKLILENEPSKEVFELYGILGDTIQLSELSTQWITDRVPYVFSINAPWEIQALREANKTYGLEGDYVYSQPIVKNKDDKPYCFGDSKGIVFYKSDNITEDMHNGAVEFVKWVYNAENSTQTDLDWLNATYMLPARGDLNENQEFVKFLEENVELQGLASFVPYAVPSMASDKMTDIQTAFTEFGFAPYFSKVQQSKDTNPIDATEYVDSAFKAMEDILK